MPKKGSNPIIVTPAMQVVLDRWNEFIRLNNIQFSPWTDHIFKAKVVSETGHCPCDYGRLSCPCELCLSEIVVSGQCFCHVFVSNKFITEHTNFS